MPLPQLQTERLLLRQLRAEDAHEIFLLRSDEAHNKYVDRPKAESIDDAKAFIDKIKTFVAAGESYFWVITEKPQDTLLGTITLWNIDFEKMHAEVGYELLSTHQYKGIMAETVAAVLTFAFNDLKMKNISAWTHPDNDRSTGVLRKFGFERDHEAEKLKPEDALEIIYSLRAEDFGK